MPGVAADEFAAACGAAPGPVLRAYIRTVDGPGARHRAVPDSPAVRRTAAVGDVHRFSLVPAACLADPAAQGPGPAVGSPADGTDAHCTARPSRRTQRGIRGPGWRPAADGAEHCRGPDSKQRARSDQGSLDQRRARLARRHVRRQPRPGARLRRRRLARSADYRRRSSSITSRQSPARSCTAQG
jgi:hypothetical protein